MNNMPVLLGRHDVDVDAIGAFTLPKEWRSALTADGTVCLLPDLHDKCLLMISKPLLDEEVTRLQTLTNDEEARLELSHIEANAQILRSDRSGRVSIPNDLRCLVGIGSAASLLGSMRCVKIWATEQLNANRKEDATWDSIVAAMNG